MEVETFEALENETGEQAPEMESEAIELIETLGLTGQQELLKPVDEDSDVLTRIPYRVMTAEEKIVYSVLCPDFTMLDEYNESPIPLRVLQVAAHACDLMEEVEVWYNGSVLVKDPVLVGYQYNFNAEPRYRAKAFILARWGDELGSLEELREKAIELWKRDALTSAKSAEEKARVFISTIESKCADHFGGQYVTIPS